MKHILLLGLLAISFCSNAQNHYKNRTDSITAICKKWNLVRSIINKEDPPFIPVDSHFFEIRKNETFEMFGQGESLKGKWELNTSKKSLITKDEEGIKNWKIIKLTNSELHLEVIDEGDTIVMIFKT